MLDYKKYDIYSDDVVIPPIETYNLTHVSNNHSFFFNSVDSLCLELEKIQQCNQDTVEHFKILVTEFTNYIEKLSNNRTLTDYRSLIISMINNNPTQIIDMFIDKCYLNGETEYPDKFRKEIVLGNESFFLKSSYGGIDSVGGINIMKEIFEFKSFWSKLKQDTKEYIKSFLLTLFYYSDKRYMLVKIYKQTVEKNKKFSRIFDKYPLTVYLSKTQAI